MFLFISQVQVSKLYSANILKVLKQTCRAFGIMGKRQQWTLWSSIHVDVWKSCLHLLLKPLIASLKLIFSGKHKVIVILLKFVYNCSQLVLMISNNCLHCLFSFVTLHIKQGSYSLCFLNACLCHGYKKVQVLLVLAEIYFECIKWKYPNIWVSIVWKQF